ncbi:retrotransposon protein, putative, ty1-copia subclass, partial [Tanacetum coccineum]
KAKGKRKGKGLQNSYLTKPKKPQPYKKERPAKDGQCHHCKEEGHWKRNCPVYLAELIKKKKKTRGQNVASTSSGIYTIELFAFPKNSWVYDIGKEAEAWGVVSVSRLVNKGFTHCFMDFGLSVSMNNMIYFNAITVNGIYKIDMRNSTLPIVKPNLDSSYLWHCRLAHINKKRIEKLQHDGLLKPTDNEPFDQCLSCISGKMTRKPFSLKTEKVKDVFKNEVENQLGKTIKAIRSDRGGEYISQEFKDYLKAYGIVQQLTPPYTPQHNGVSERRNRTLLNMVRSMMSLTTSPLSFWDYALDSAARILNMVPTKKADKTPYELWHGKVPNLSYLKVWGCEAHVKRHTPDQLCLNVKIDPDRLSFNIEVEEHNLGDLYEPANYKTARTQNSKSGLLL